MKMEYVFIVLKAAVSTPHENIEDTMNEILAQGSCLLTNTEHVGFFKVNLLMITNVEPKPKDNGTSA
ncbi:MAG: hypothetical protein J7577_11875 [Sphingobacteriaceae bacterium]|nr:hypothetical protein [Sphingobacteriaceae bacterium]